VLGVGREVSVSGNRDERIATIAELQRGFITREQLRGVAISDTAIARLVARGRLVRVHQGVYAVRPAMEVPLGRETAALLACGPNALLSHGSAAALWKLCEPLAGVVDVTISRRRNRQTPGIVIHRTAKLLQRDVRVVQKVPLTSPARTLLDRAAQLTTHDLERELDEALSVLRIVRPDEIEDILARTRGHRGGPVLTRLLGVRAHETITQSEAERLFLELVRDAGLPEPETQVRIAGYRVDFLWRRERVVFEIDGFRFHTSRRAFDRDRAEDLALKQERFDPNRVSRDQVKHEPLKVLAHVVAALARAAR
jgi:very-short-patch-repair endonuclease